MGYIRNKTRPQGDRPIQHKQDNFGQGLNVDIPASDFDNNAVQNLENYIAFERYTEGRSGSVHVHDLPGTGTVHSIEIHPTEKVCIMHRGTQIWEVKTSDAEVKSFLSTTALGSPASLGIDKPSTLKPFGNNFMLFTDDGIFQILIEYPNKSFFKMNSGQPLDVDQSGVSDGKYVYKWKTVYTYSIIVDTATGLAAGPGVKRNSSGYKLIWESPPVLSGESSIANTSYFHLRVGASPTGSGVGFASYGTKLGPLDIAAGIEEKVTHMSTYQTEDLGVNNLNNLAAEQFAWCTDTRVDHSDYPNQTSSFFKSDTEIKNALREANLRLRGVNYTPLPSGKVGEVTSNFVFSTILDDKLLSYSDRIPDEGAGFYNAAVQFYEADDGITVLAATPDVLSVITRKKSYIATLTSTQNLLDIIVLDHFTIKDDTLGVSDPGSFVKVEDGAYIAICSDKSIRVWDGESWSRDLAEDRVRSIIERIEEGTTVGGYYRGAYFIWFKLDDNEANNNICMRLSVKRESGKGFTFYTGDDWSYPDDEGGVFAGPNFLDTAQANLEFFFIVDVADDKIYWIETFDGPDNQTINGYQITRYWADKVSASSPNGTQILPKMRGRDVTGEKESFNIKHSESHAYLRDIIGKSLSIDIPNPPASGLTYPELFVDAIAFVNGSQVSVETAGKVKTDGDIQFWYRVEGSRIAIEFQANRSGHRLVGTDTRYRVQDIQRPNRGPANTVASTFQEQMLDGLKNWLFSRPRTFVNRITQLVTPNALISTKIGPDGRNAAVQVGVNQAPFERFRHVDKTVYSGEFTISFWVSDVEFDPSDPTILMEFQDAAGTANFTLQATDATTLTILEGAGTVTVDALNGLGPVNDYHQIMLVRSTGSDVRVYQNDELKGTLTFSGSFGGGFFQVGEQA